MSRIIFSPCAKGVRQDTDAMLQVRGMPHLLIQQRSQALHLRPFVLMRTSTFSSV